MTSTDTSAHISTEAPTTQPVADPRPTLFAAVDQVVRLIDLVPGTALAQPTPCAEFDVRHLLGHLVAVLGRIAYVAGGGNAFDVPSMMLDIPDDAWSDRAHQGAAAVGQAWADDAVLDRVLTLPFGTVPGRGAGVAYISELTTHAWDLAAAIGQRHSLDDALGAVALTAARTFIPDTHRGEIPFGAAIPVSEGASAYDQLAAWLGRDPAWGSDGTHR